MRFPSDWRPAWKTMITCAILSLFGIGLTGCQKTAVNSPVERDKTPERLEVTVAEATRMDIAAPVEFVGNLLPRKRTMVVAQVDGVIQSITASGAKVDVTVDGKRYTEQLGLLPGQSVQAEQVLVELDPVEYELALLTAKSKLAKTEAELQQLLAGLRPEEIQRLRAARDEAAARHKLALSEFERTKRLSQQDAISRSERDQAGTEVETAKAVLASAEAAVRAAEAGPTKEEIAVAEAAVAQEAAAVSVAEEKLTKATVRAPYDGVVTDIYAEEGDRVSAAAGSQLLEIMDLRFLIAQVGVPEAYLGKIHLEDRATMTIAGRTEPIPAMVVSINSKVDYDSRTFRVRVAIDNTDGFFKAGQFAVVRFAVSSSQQAIVVPSEAIIYQEGQPHVYVYRNGQVERRRVTPDVESDSHVEITSGLDGGEQVVVDDPSLLTDGMSVDLRAPGPAFISSPPGGERGAL